MGEWPGLVPDIVNLSYAIILKFKKILRYVYKRQPGFVTNIAVYFVL